LIPKNGSGSVTVTFWSFSGTGTITAKGNTGAHITVSPLTQQVTDSCRHILQQDDQQRRQLLVALRLSQRQRENILTALDLWN
jgi:hypothetical protein